MKDTKSHILNISLKLFLEKGFADVSMNELVAASGLSKGAFYHYFKSKDRLYEETLNTYFFSYLDNFPLTYNEQKDFRNNLKDLYTNLVNMMNEIREIIGSDIHIISYYRTIWESMTRNPAMRKAIESYYKQYMMAMNQWIEKGKNNREIKKEINNGILGYHISSLIEGILVIYSYQESGKNLYQIYDQVFGQLYELISLKNEN